MMVERGRAPSEIVVTGNPAFDSLVEVSRLRSLKLPGVTFNVLWAAHEEPAVHPISGVISPSPKLPELIVAELIRCAERHKNWDIVIRPHPTMVDYVVDGPANLKVVGDDPLDDRLVWADVVITVASTVAIQAALAGIPVIAVGGSVISSDVSFVEDGIARGTTVAPTSVWSSRSSFRQTLSHSTPGFPSPEVQPSASSMSFSACAEGQAAQSHPLPARQAAIDADVLANDIARCVGEQKGDHARDPRSHLPCAPREREPNTPRRRPRSAH